MRLIALHIFFLIAFLPGFAQAEFGASIDNRLRYKQDFKHFDYVFADARKGGRLILHDLGSFDKLNPFTLKGASAYGVEEFLFDPLGVQSLDEPFSVYGLIAKDIAVAKDRSSVTITLNENATFSDGSPIQLEDLMYTIDIFKSDKVHPFYNSYYKDIEGYEALDATRLRVNFKQPNRELHLIVAQMKILPRSRDDIFTDKAVKLTDNSKYPLGSGPYLIKEVNPGKSITFGRNINYWAVDHPTRAGMYNFDEIVIKYYKDPVVALEAFKAGEFDFISINIAKQWARDLVGKRFEDGSLVKKSFPHKNIAGLQGFTINTRKPLFKDVRVRKALGLALNFEWVNEALFHGQYVRNDSYFSNSYLAARGLPEGLELEYLNPFKMMLPKEVFTQPLSPPRVRQPHDLRTNLLEAKVLLEDAGWTVENGILTNTDGKKFIFDVMLSSQTLERVVASYANNLKKLGIIVNYRTIDPALYMERVESFNYDMIVSVYAQSQSPGNEQLSYWHSSSVDRPGSRNYAGVNSEVVDNLVEKIVYAKNQEQLTAACKALDRVLWYGYYTVPNWYLAFHRLAYSRDFMQPENQPLYYSPLDLLMTWWKN